MQWFVHKMKMNISTQNNDKYIQIDIFIFYKIFTNSAVLTNFPIFKIALKLIQS